MQADDHHKFESTFEDEASMAVIRTVAALEDTDPGDLSGLRPLASQIDPEALDTLTQNEDVVVQFQYEGYEIRIDGAGTIYAE